MRPLLSEDWLIFKFLRWIIAGRRIKKWITIVALVQDLEGKRLDSLIIAILFFFYTSHSNHFPIITPSVAGISGQFVLLHVTQNSHNFRGNGRGLSFFGRGSRFKRGFFTPHRIWRSCIVSPAYFISNCFRSPIRPKQFVLKLLVYARDERSYNWKKCVTSECREISIFKRTMPE